MDRVDTGSGAPALERTFKATWMAAVFGLLVGTTMVYVPYQFGAAAFRYIYDYTRPLGAGFLSGAVLIAIAAFYPKWPRALDLVGRALFLGSLGIYWWFATVLVGGVTGTVVYPLMMLSVVAEAIPAVRRRLPGTFIPFLGLSAAFFGVAMLALPSRFPSTIYGGLQPWLWVVGASFLVLGPSLLWAAWRGRRRALSVLVALVSLPFVALGLTLAVNRSWSGAQLYVAIVGTSVAFLIRPRMNFSPSIRWRLWRGMVLAACVPLLALGGLACVLMQHAIESQALEDAKKAVVSEVEWLGNMVESQRDALAKHASTPAFLQAVKERDDEVLALSLQVFSYHARRLEAAYVTAADGTVLARTEPSVPSGATVAHRPFFQAAQQDGSFVSTPVEGVDGESRVSIAVAMKDESGPVGMLVGTLSVDELSRPVFASSAAYAVHVIDRRDQKLVRAARDSGALWIPPVVSTSIATAEEGSYVGADEHGRQVLVTWARVPNTPWLVLARQDVARAFAFVTRLGVGAVALVTAAALLALLLSQLVAREVTRRLRRVREAAEALAQGDMQRRVDPEGGDELATLADSFNQMAERMEGAQSQLERINTDLQAAVQIRDEFLSMASHELRTPLTPLKATAQTLRVLIQRHGAQLDQARVLTMLERVDRQTDRLALLVSDMLDISRIQSGKFSLQPAQMDLSALVDEVVDRVRSVNESNAERIRCTLPPVAVEGVWDAARLEQVVVNLLENAIRYSPKGGPIELSLHVDGERVRLTVSDEGIGIPAENVQQLFEPFFRASNAAARHYGGLGLGLHICREIVSRHGGKIWAESEGENKGSRFHVELPRASSATAPTEERAA